MHIAYNPVISIHRYGAALVNKERLSSWFVAACHADVVRFSQKFGPADIFVIVL